MISLKKYPEYNEKKYVIDGANICWIRKNKNGRPMLRNFMLLLKELAHLGIKKEKIISIFDASLKHKIDRRNDYERFLSQNNKLLESPARIKADDVILGYCLTNHDALIISNDMFRDYYNQVPSKKWVMERRIVVSLVSGEILLNPCKN